MTKRKYSAKKIKLSFPFLFFLPFFFFKCGLMLPGWPQSPPLLGLWIIVLYVTHTVFTDIFSVALVFHFKQVKITYTYFHAP